MLLASFFAVSRWPFRTFWCKAVASQLDCFLGRTRQFPPHLRRLTHLSHCNIISFKLKRLIGTSVMMQTISSSVDVDYITKALALHWPQRKKWKHAHRALIHEDSIQIHRLALNCFLLCKGVCKIKQITLQPQPGINPTGPPSQWGLSCPNS